MEEAAVASQAQCILSFELYRQKDRKRNLSRLPIHIQVWDPEVDIIYYVRICAVDFRRYIPIVTGFPVSRDQNSTLVPGVVWATPEFTS